MTGIEAVAGTDKWNLVGKPWKGELGEEWIKYSRDYLYGKISIDRGAKRVSLLVPLAHIQP